jgi:prephenate dehydratase
MKEVVVSEVEKKSVESAYYRQDIAIQGIEGSFHHIAAMNYFGDNINLIPCERFEDVFRSLNNKKANKAILAIENSVAGTILPNYALLRNQNYKIVGEVYLRIKHQLLTIKNQKIGAIKVVQSHPMALLQCQHFFEKYPHIRLVESDDTAASAKRLVESAEMEVAVIASQQAGEVFELNTIAKDIEDNKRNFTRFLILDKECEKSIVEYEINKASICFHLSHEAGSLAKVLTHLATENINLTKIQSLPIVGREWEYFFHLDMEFDNYNNYNNGLKKIKSHIYDLQILGEYQKGKTY